MYATAGLLLNQTSLSFDSNPMQITPVPAESVTVEQYLRAECHRFEARVTVSIAGK